MLVTERFVKLANATFKGKGASNEAMVVLPPTEDTEYTDAAGLKPITEKALGDILAKLTHAKPLEA